MYFSFFLLLQCMADGVMEPPCFSPFLSIVLAVSVLAVALRTDSADGADGAVLKQDGTAGRQDGANGAAGPQEPEIPPPQHL